MKRVLSIDIDGTAYSYLEGYKGDTHIEGPPNPGFTEIMAQYVKQFTVVLISSRFNSVRTRRPAMQAVTDWLRHHEIPGSEIVYHWNDWHDWSNAFDEECIILCASRPPSLRTIDDRGYHFTGTWPTVQELTNFKVWNKQAQVKYAQDKDEATATSLHNRPRPAGNYNQGLSRLWPTENP
jgi:hypothetical protein